MLRASHSSQDWLWRREAAFGLILLLIRLNGGVSSSGRLQLTPVLFGLLDVHNVNISSSQTNRETEWLWKWKWIMSQSSQTQREPRLWRTSLVILYFQTYILLASGSSIFSSQVHPPSPPSPPSPGHSNIQYNESLPSKQSLYDIRQSFFFFFSVRRHYFPQENGNYKKSKKKKFIHFIHQQWPTSATEPPPPSSLITLH